MSDSVEDFDYAFQQQLSMNGRSNTDHFRFRSSYGGMPQETDENIARIITSGAQVSSPAHRAVPTRMGFRAYQAAVRENKEHRDYSYSSDNYSEDNEQKPSVNRSLAAAMIDSEEEAFQLINISIYDSTNFASTILRMNRRLTSKEVCRALSHKMDLSKDEAMYHTLVVVITVFDSEKRINVHCVRTFQNEEIVLNVLDSLVGKLTERYKVLDVTRMKNSIRWYFKDVRTPPIEFPDGEEATGEDSSDDEEEVSHSDLAYLAKAERKGYLLKRSSRDQNLWRKWYCVLTDHLWCIDIQRKTPTAICIRLSGMIRSSHHHNKYNSSYNNRRPSTGGANSSFGFPFGNSSSSSFLSSSTSSTAISSSGNSGSSSYSSEEQQLHSIVINSTRGTHLLRAFNLAEQKKWIEDLHAKTKFALENDYFNMAEVIVCDEENTKSKRFHKAVDDLLEIPMFYESLSLDHRSLQYTTVMVDLSAEDQIISSEYSSSIHSGKMSPINDSSKPNMDNVFNGITNGDIEYLDLPKPAAPTTTASVKVAEDETAVVEALRNRLPSSANITVNGGSVNPPMVSTRVQFSTINPVDRTIHTSSLHRMYDYDVLFTHLLRMVLDILHFKELFRHDLFITQSYQRQIAVYIFVKYLLPILQIQASSSYQRPSFGTENNSSRVVDLSLNDLNMQQIAFAVQQFSGKAMKNNGFVQDEKELLRYTLQVQSLIERSKRESAKYPSSPSRSPHQPKDDSPLDATFLEDAQEQVNRLDLMWDLPHEALIRVYQALFVPKSSSPSTSPLSLTGTTNSDRYKASGAYERSPQQEESMKQGASTNTSFWSWFSSGSSANSTSENSDLRSNKSRYQEGGDTSSHEHALNYPSQDLFDPVLEELIKMLMVR